MNTQAKKHHFNKDDIGRWVIIQRPKYNRDTVQRLFLVDREKTKAWWWSPNADYAKRYDSQIDAELQVKRYKYGKIKAVQITYRML